MGSKRFYGAIVDGVKKINDYSIRVNITFCETSYIDRNICNKKVSFPVKFDSDFIPCEKAPSEQSFISGKHVIIECLFRGLYNEAEQWWDRVFVSSLSTDYWTEFPAYDNHQVEYKFYFDYADYQEGMLVQAISSPDTYENYKFRITPIIKFPGQSQYMTIADVVPHPNYDEFTITNLRLDKDHSTHCFGDSIGYSIPAWKAFIEKHHEEDVVKGNVYDWDNDSNGLTVKIDDLCVVLPVKEIKLDPHASPKKYIGKTISVKILRIDYDKHQVIVSMKQTRQNNQQNGSSSDKKQPVNEISELVKRIEKLEERIAKLEGTKSEGDLHSTIKKHDNWW